MHDKGNHQKFFVAKLLNENATKKDHQAEAEKAGPKNCTKLATTDVELTFPVAAGGGSGGEANS